MRPTKKTLSYVLVLAALLMFAGLGGWYFFLNRQAETVSATDASRGLRSEAPSRSVGNIYNNIVSGITSLVERDGDETREGASPPQLQKITKTPVAGMAFGAGTSSVLYFAESSTGYIFSADTSTGAVERLTNRLFPKTQEAVFSRDGSVVLRSIDENGDIASFAGKIATSTSSETVDGGATLSGKYLERNISAIVPAAFSRELLYIVKTPFGGADGILSSWDGMRRKTVFSSPLSGWYPISLADGRIFFVLRPADNAAGFAYELKNGSLVPQVRDARGLTYLPNTSSAAILYGESGGGSLALFARAQNDATSLSLPIRTVADKCVWSTEGPAIATTTTPKIFSKKPAPMVKPLVAYCAVPQFVTSNAFLNDWYRGAIHTSDSWWRVDVSADTVELIFAPETDTPIDVESPIMDDRGEHIAFINAIDKTLWLLRIKPEKIKTTP